MEGDSESYHEEGRRLEEEVGGGGGGGGGCGVGVEKMWHSARARCIPFRTEITY
jgi:hypothetical protein